MNGYYKLCRGIYAGPLLYAGWQRRPALAGGGPENIFLVVNSGGAASKEVANHYIALRHVPSTNVFYLPTPPNAYRITGLDFREKLLRPILAEIDAPRPEGSGRSDRIQL